MSIENAQAFIVKVQNDEGLRSEVIALGQNYEGLIQLAEKHSYSFTAEELKSTAQTYGYNTGQTISEENLKAVAGGLSVASDSGGVGPHTSWTSRAGSCC